MKRNPSLLISLLLCLVPWAQAAETPAVRSIPIAKIKHAGAVNYENEILPILKNNCLACHNQTKPKGGLVLETPQTMLKGGDAGPAVVPKKPGESLLLKAAAHQDPELIMPPAENKVAALPLTSEELGLLQLWIEQGAKGEVRASLPIVWQPVPPGLNAIYAAALTRDGQFAACGRANQIFLYHLPTGQLVARLNDPQLQKTSNAGAAHRDTVNSLAFSPDGALLASGGYREVKLWRRGKAAEKFKLPVGSDRIAASADARWIAAASTNGDVKLLDPAGQLVRTIPGQSGRIASLKFAPGTNAIAMGRGKGIELISVPAGNSYAKVEMTGEIASLAFLGPSRLVVASGDNMIRLIGPSSNSAALEVLGELAAPAPVAFLEASAASTNQFLAGSPDGTVRLWDLATRQVVAEVRHGTALTSLAMRPDGKYFATAGGKAAKLWKVGETNAAIELKGDGRAVWLVGEKERELSFSKLEVDFRAAALKTAETNQVTAAARQKKAMGTNAVLAGIATEKQTALTNAMFAQTAAGKILDDLGPEVRKLLDALATAQKESTNAAALAKAAKAGTDQNKAAKLAVEAVTKSNLLMAAKAALDALPAETKAQEKFVSEKLAVANKSVPEAEKEFKKAEQAQSIAENELKLAVEALLKSEAAVVGAKAVLGTVQAGLTQAEKAHEAAQQARARAETPVRALAFSPDNRTIMTASEDGAVRTWSAETGAPFDNLAAKSGAIRGLAALGELTLVAVGDEGGAVWNIRAGWTLERLIGTGESTSPLADRVNALRFTADGQQLITGGGEPTRGGEIKLWRVQDGMLVREFPNVHSDSVFALDVSADGKFLASGAADRFAKVTDLASGKVVKTFEGHTHHVLGVAWKRDGRTLITTGADNVAKVWDATTGERRKNIEGFGKEVTAVAFVGVGAEAVLGAGDGQVMLVKGNGDKVRSFPGATDYVYTAAVAPDGSVVLAGGADGVLRAWDGKDGKLRVEFPPR